MEWVVGPGHKDATLLRKMFTTHESPSPVTIREPELQQEKEEVRGQQDQRKEELRREREGREEERLDRAEGEDL
jgi:hypothetical protein